MATIVGVGVSGVTLVGTDAAPLAFGGTGTGSDVLTYTHNVGVRAEKVEVLSPTNHALIPNSLLAVTQPSVNAIVVTNTAGSTTALLRITWATPAISLTAPVAASDAAIVFS